MFQTDIDYTCIGRPRMDGQSVNKSAENEKTILRVVVELHEKTVYIMTLVSDVLVNHAVVNRHCWTLTPPPLDLPIPPWPVYTDRVSGHVTDPDLPVILLHLLQNDNKSSYYSINVLGFVF